PPRRHAAPRAAGPSPPHARQPPPRRPHTPSTPRPHHLTPITQTARPLRQHPAHDRAQHQNPNQPPSASTDEAPEPPSTAAAASRAPTTSAASATIREKFTG